MFTGLIQELGKVTQINSIEEGKELLIYCPPLLPFLKVDDSVSINGVCQTVVSLTSQFFIVHCVHISLEKTTLKNLRKGEEVNLELAMRLGDRLGGHIVQGHVNGMGKILQIQKIGKNLLIQIRAPQELRPYMVKEGSIALDGVSLTIADQQGHEFWVSVIPHTYQKTTLKNKKVGDDLNIEVDILAKYVEGLLNHRQKKDDSVVPSNQSMTKKKNLLESLL